jgi:FAD/FMN-containing dehydrogenase
MIRNFGGNVKFEPNQYVEPHTEQELLQVMAANPNRRFRVVGTKHSWSPLIPTDDVSISIKHLNSVKLTPLSNGRVLATVGGGCTIRRLLKLLNEHGLTTPTVGLITSQTIAGAVSTATHGSGRYSFSHYLKQVRLATIDADAGQPVIRTFDRGLDVAAARCSLGCLGVIIDVQFTCVPQYNVAERIKVVNSLDEVLRLEHRNPIQQFYIIPHVEEFYVAARRLARSQDEIHSWKSVLFRLYWLLGIDIGFHFFIMVLAYFQRSRKLIQGFYRRLFPRLILKDRIIVDRSDRVLTMAHELFRHFETELFVPESHIHEAVAFVQTAVNAFSDRDGPVSGSFATRINEAGMTERLHQLRGTWIHHYPICVRKVLPDDTFLSMSAGTGPWYAISFITYDRDRRDFRNFSAFMTRTMASAFGARPHWGKHFDLPASDLRKLYPKFDRFNRVRRQLDPNARFSNTFVDELMNSGSEL